MMPNYALFLINNFFLNLIFLAFWVVFSREPDCFPQIARGKTSSYWLGCWLLPTRRSSWMRSSRVIQDVWMTCVEGESPEWWVSSGSLGQLNESFGNSYIFGSAISMMRWLASRLGSAGICKRNITFDPWVGTQSANYFVNSAPQGRCGEVAPVLF